VVDLFLELESFDGDVLSGRVLDAVYATFGVCDDGCGHEVDLGIECVDGA
jgi:hypothetical protein